MKSSPSLTLCSECQIESEDFVNFCGLVRKHELYQIVSNPRTLGKKVPSFGHHVTPRQRFDWFKRWLHNQMSRSARVFMNPIAPIHCILRIC